MSTFAGKDLRSYPDQICGGRTKSASVICPPGQNLLALSVPPDQICGRTDFTVTPAGKLPGNKQRLREIYREISFLIHGCYCGNYDININILLYICVQKKIVIERTRDLIYLKFVATDFFPKISSPSAGENSGDLA